GGRGQPIEVLPVHTVCTPREGRCTRQGLGWSQGEALHPQLTQRVATAAVGVMAVCIAGGERIDPLGQEVAQGMSNRGGRAGIVDGGRQACGEADLAIDAAEYEDTKIRGQGASLEIGTDSMTRNGMKRQLFGSRIGHGQTASDLYGIDRSHVLFYQRLGGSLPFFMKNPG